MIELLQAQEGKFVLVSRLAASFRSCFGRKFPLNSGKLEEFIKSLEGTIKASILFSLRVCVINSVFFSFQEKNKKGRIVFQSETEMVIIEKRDAGFP